MKRGVIELFVRNCYTAEGQPLKMLHHLWFLIGCLGAMKEEQGAADLLALTTAQYDLFWPR